jgi:hypothetical protein
MAVITLPDNNFRSAQWTLVQPTQVNRSEFTGARQVMQLPGASYWRASVEHVPIKGEANVRAWRSFFARLQGQVNTFRLIASEGAQYSGANPRIGSFGVMVDIANCDILGADLGTVFKRPGTGSAWNAGAYSSGRTSGPDVVAFFKANQTNADLVVGLSTSPTASSGFADIPHAWFCNASGNLQILESGTPAPTAVGSYTTSTVLGIKYTGTNIEYLKDGAVLRTVSAGASTYRIDSSIYTPSASFSLVRSSFAGLTKTLYLSGLPASQTPLRAGMFVTLISGASEQLVVLTSDVATDSLGVGVINFEPGTRMTTTEGVQIEAIQPYALVALDTPEASYSVDPGAVYGFGFSVTEAY